MTTKQNRTSRQDRDRKKIAGIQKDLQPNAQVTLGGVAYTATQLVQFYQGRIATEDGVVAAQASAHVAVETARTKYTETHAIDVAFESWLHATYANQLDKLADYGVAPRKTRALTVEQKAIAKARMRATRGARHTMGAMQKKTVKGQVTLPVAVGEPAPPGAGANAGSGNAASGAAPASPGNGAPAPANGGGNGSPPHA
jgi:hypothetical protein